MSEQHLNLAIDGPSGAGKSTVARSVAQTLGILYLDTGALYRALAWYATENQIAPDAVQDLEALLVHCPLDLRFVGGQQQIWMGSRHLDAELRLPQMSKLASDFSAVPCVRQALLALQRKTAKEQSCVLDGRDIGSFVLPEAPIKIYLTADVRERACRRWAELQQRSTPQTFDQVLQEMQERDLQDSTRAIAPLVQAPDAVVIDSTHLTIEEVTRKIVQLTLEKFPNAVSSVSVGEALSRDIQEGEIRS